MKENGQKFKTPGASGLVYDYIKANPSGDDVTFCNDVTLKVEIVDDLYWEKQVPDGFDELPNIENGISLIEDNKNFFDFLQVSFKRPVLKFNNK